MGVVFSSDNWFQQGNGKVLIHVTADQSGTSVTWKAEATAARTLAYKQVIRQSPEEKVYAYYTYGNKTSYCTLRVNGTSFYKAAVVGEVASGRSVSNSGWIGWGYASNKSTATLAAPWTDYTVDVLISGGGQSTQTKRIYTATTTPTPVEPEPTFLAGAKVKEGGSWISITNGFVKVEGVWKEIEAGYVKENGVWRPLT